MSSDISGNPPPGRRAPSPQAQLLNRIGQAAPYAIVVYAIILVSMRIGFSPFLDVDEAGLVGHVNIALIYPGSQPPLFHWATRIVLEFTDWDWAASLAVVRYSALALFYVAIWDTARRLGGYRTALMAMAAAALAPQIGWLSVVALTHATLTMALAALALNMLVRAFEDPNERTYLQFGLVAGLGVLSSFSFLFFLVPILAATALEAELRYAFKRKPLLYAAAGFGGLVLPMLIGAAIDWTDATSGLDQLYGDAGWLSAVDPPLLGLDGLLTLIVAIIAWTGAGAAIWFGARAYDRTFGPLQGAAHPFAPVLARAMAFGLAGFAAIVLVFDMSTIEPRMLSPMFAAFPIWLAVAWPLKRAALPVAGLALLVMTLAPVGYWLGVRYTAHRFAAPYSSVAAQVARETEYAPTPLVAERVDDAANMVLARVWPGAVTPTTLPLENKAVLVWRGDRDAPADLAPEGFAPAGGVKSFRAPLLNESGEEMFFSFQLYERLAPDARLVGSEPHEETAPPPETDPVSGPPPIDVENLSPYAPGVGVDE